MPSKSPRQARLMAGAAHNPVFAKKVGVPQDVAKEFNNADDHTGTLSRAMRSGPKPRSYSKGGRVKPTKYC